MCARRFYAVLSSLWRTVTTSWALNKLVCKKKKKNAWNKRTTTFHHRAASALFRMRIYHKGLKNKTKQKKMENCGCRYISVRAETRYTAIIVTHWRFAMTINENLVKALYIPTHTHNVIRLINLLVLYTGIIVTGGPIDIYYYYYQKPVYKLEVNFFPSPHLALSLVNHYVQKKKKKICILFAGGTRVERTLSSPMLLREIAGNFSIS